MKTMEYYTSPVWCVRGDEIEQTTIEEHLFDNYYHKANVVLKDLHVEQMWDDMDAEWCYRVMYIDVRGRERLVQSFTTEDEARLYILGVLEHRMIESFTSYGELYHNHEAAIEAVAEYIMNA